MNCEHCDYYCFDDSQPDCPHCGTAYEIDTDEPNDSQWIPIAEWMALNKKNKELQ